MQAVIKQIRRNKEVTPHPEKITVYSEDYRTNNREAAHKS
jgi:hypothetical protein